MKAGWRTENLGNICDILDNLRKPITKCDRTSGAYPYYGATGILDYVEGYLFDEPLVLVGEDGAKWASGENTAFAIQGKCWVNNHAHVLRPHRSILADNWLIHFLVHSDLSPFVSGLTVPKLNQGNLREISIPVPPLPEQQRIVGILDGAFDGIAIAKANAEKNLQNARALFESHLQAVFTQRGEGWVETQIEDVCTKITDGEHLRPKMTSSGVPFLSAKDVLDNELVFTDSLFVSEDDAVKFRKRCNPETGDILIVSRGATVGRTCIVNTNRIFCLLGSVILLKVKTDYSPKFISYALKSPAIKNQLMTVSEAAAQQAIYLRDIKPVIIVCPSLEEQSKIVSQLDSLYDETQRLESIYQQKLAALAALKKSLLDQAFRGEL